MIILLTPSNDRRFSATKNKIMRMKNIANTNCRYGRMDSGDL